MAKQYFTSYSMHITFLVAINLALTKLYKNIKQNTNFKMILNVPTHYSVN